MSRFWLTSGVRAPGSAQKRHLEALVDRFLPDPSADARTPQNGVLSALFAPRSLQEGQCDRETKHALHSHKAITFGMFDGSPVHRKERRALGSHFHGVGGHPTTALQMALFGAPRSTALMVLVFTKFHGVMAIPLRHRLTVFPCSAACGCSQKTGYYFEDITLIASTSTI